MRTGKEIIFSTKSQCFDFIFDQIFIPLYPFIFQDSDQLWPLLIEYLVTSPHIPYLPLTIQHIPTPLDPPNAQTRHRLRKKRWDAANELRGAVSENNYKNYILPLVFVKHLSERDDMVKERQMGLRKDGQSAFYTIKKIGYKLCARR